jgi:hypothetical protein
MAEENTGSGAAPVNVSEDQEYTNPFGQEDTDGDAGATTVYKPEEGKYGPKPYGEYTPPEYENGDPQGIKSGRAYQQQYQQQYDEQGQPYPVDPLQELSPYMDDAELAFVQSLNPQQQGYFLNAAARIKGVYETQAQQVAEYEEQLEAVAQEIEPLKDMSDALTPKLIENGGFDSVGEYIECLVEADMAARENPQEWILDMMKHYGITLSNLMDNAETYIDKINDPYYHQAQQAQRERDNYASYLQQVEAEKAEAENAYAIDYYAGQINEFANEADEYGLLHPYYDLVESKMSELMAQSGSLDLDDLYEQACWLVPEVRADIIANGGGYDNGYDSGYYDSGYYQEQPSYQNFATSNTGGDAAYQIPSGDDNFKEIFERNYKKFVGNPY